MIQYGCAGKKCAKSQQKGGDSVASKNDEDIIDGICEKGRLIRLAEKYILNCLESEGRRPRLPNVCGFFRWLKLGAIALDRLKHLHPEKYRTLLMIFEDEALNSELPPSIISTYMKQSFTGKDAESEGADTEKSQPITLIFDHDIDHDGR
jgi:hypothetical protein